MKKITTLAIALIISFGIFAQESVYFVKKNAALNGAFRPQDTLSVMDNQIIRISNFSSVVGATVEWQGLNGEVNATEVFEEVNDSTSTKASLSFTISNVDTITAITVNGVSICDTIKSAPTADSLAILVKDSINALAAYTATVSGAVVTVTEDTASDSRNGQIINVIYGTDSSLAVSFTGGRTDRAVNSAVRNAKMFQATEGGAVKYFSAWRVGNIIGTSAGGSIVKYNAIRTREISVTNSASSLRSTINGL